MPLISIYKLDKHIHLKCSCQTSTKRYFLIDVLLDCNKFRITYIHIKQMLPHDVMLFINYINILKVIFYTTRTNVSFQYGWLLNRCDHMWRFDCKFIFIYFNRMSFWKPTTTLQKQTKITKNNSSWNLPQNPRVRSRAMEAISENDVKQLIFPS
jgi:hypothetical protein